MFESWRLQSNAARLRAVAIVLIAVAALVDAARHSWVSDDIFITFRYCDNVLAGHGAVYNPGERSEGYTHFLWFLLLTLGRALGIDAEALGRWAVWPAFAGSLVWLLRISQRLWPRRGGLWGVPLAMLAWALHEDARRFASGGLETMAFTWALLIGVEALLHDEPRRRALWAAWAFAVATLLRPDGLLYSALAGGCMLWMSRDDRRAVRDFALVWAALVLPLFAFRLAYYGWLFPNPYYAKSGGGAYWSQGWIYTQLYFGSYWPLLASLLALPAIRSAWRAGKAARQQARVLVFLLAAAAITVVYVTRVGGDFMFARFYLPVTPFLLLLVEAAVQHLSRAGWRAAAAIACCALMVFGVVRKHSKVGDKRNVAGIVDEPQFYPRERLGQVRQAAATLEGCLSGTQAKVFVGGGQAALAYYARFPIAIERFGLTDAAIAHQPIVKRGRPGHEKMASPEYVYGRGVNLRLLYQPVRNVPQYTLLRLAGLDGDILVYDRALMDHLKRCPGAQFLDFPIWLAQTYLPQVERLRPERLVADWGQFQHYYFDHNPDPEGLRERLRAALAARGVTALPASLPPVFVQDPGVLQR